MKTEKQKPMVYPELQDDAAMAHLVEEGLPVLDVVEFATQAGFSHDELARLIHIPPRTFARRIADKKRLKIPEGERAIRLMRLYDQANQVFGSGEVTREWFNAKLRALGGRTPLEYAQTEPGAREVENILGRIEHGVYS